MPNSDYYELMQARARIDDLEGELEDSQNKVEDLEEQVKRLQEEVDFYSDKVTSIQDKLVNYDYHIRSAADEIDDVGRLLRERH